MANGRHKKKNNQWIHQTVEVGPPLKKVSFIGKKLSEDDIPIPLNREEVIGEKFHSLYCTLYQTPEEGYKLHIEEYVLDNREILPGQEFPVPEVIRKILCSEEDAKKEYPEIFEELFVRAQSLL